MAVRGFPGGFDSITVGPGTTGAGLNGAFSTIALVKPTSSSSGEGYFGVRGAGGLIGSLADGGGGRLAAYTATLAATGDVGKTTGAWQWYVERKAAGTNHPRFSAEVLGSGSWTHTDGGGDSLPDDATPITSFLLGLIPGSPFTGLGAMFAFLPGIYLSDADVESLETFLTSQRVVDLGGDDGHVWDLNQASTDTPVIDLTGNGANQTAIFGTTIVEGDDPPSYAFGATAAPTNIVAPAVTGTATLGQTLTTTHGAWAGSPLPTYAYQWERDDEGGGTWSPVSGATSTTHLLGAEDLACMVRCVVTATNTEAPDGVAASSNAVGPSAPRPKLVISVRGSGTSDLGGPEGGVVDGEALWDLVTGEQGQDGHTDYRLVYVHNDDTIDVLVSAWLNPNTFTYPGEVYLQIGLATEGAGETVTPIANETTAPAGVTFSVPVTEETGITFTLPAGDGQGLWVKRATPPLTPENTFNLARLMLSVTPA